MTERGRNKRQTALFIALILFFHSIPFGELTFAATGQDISWSREALDTAAMKGYIPTGLSYRTSTSGIKPEYGYMGEKQYLHGSGKYSEFTNRFIYCINFHKDNGGKLLWDAQAFHSNTYNINKMPADIIKGVSEKERKFNFLMIVYASSYQSKQDKNTLEPPDSNVGVDVLTICSSIVQSAADAAVFTGEWNADFGWFNREVYPRALDAVGPDNTLGDSATYRQLTSTDIPQWAKEKGCSNRAQAIFCYIWTAAKLSSHLTIENNRDSWRYEAILEQDGMYHVRIPFEGENQFILEYLRTIQAECYGDWKKLDDTNCIHFISPSGLVPSEGSIARLTAGEGEGLIARNLSEAKLYEFKFYAEGKQGPGFDNIQSYFSALMEQELEIYLITGPSAPNGSSDAEVQRYEHEESWNADYNVSLIKYDSETGKPLKGAHFDILEGFDDSQLDDTALDLPEAEGGDVLVGSLKATTWGDDSIDSNYDGDKGLLQTKALLYNWANDGKSQFERWSNPEEDPCIDDDDITGSNGRLTYRNGVGQPTGEKAHFDVRSYVYRKGYCNGHPAPVIEYEEPDDEEEDDIDAYNQQLHDEAWAAWYREVETCADLAAEGGFFHAIEPGTACKAMEEDRDRFYKDFISLVYDYSGRELAARKGYILHDLHGDDVEIEWRRVTSSQYKDFVKNGISHTGEKMREGEADNVSVKAALEEEDVLTVQGCSDPTAFFFLDEDSGYTSASPSEAGERSYRKASSSEAGEATSSEIATLSEMIRRKVMLTGLMSERNTDLKSIFSALFAAQKKRGGSMRGSVSFQSSQASTIVPGTSDTVDWTFILYDHRTEGEVHINKRDLDLAKGETKQYDSYGDTQGDGTLEGAVYGLFAAADLVHPDGKTGVVFQKDDLVAVASTDKNGDASFLVITEAPGTRFDFETGTMKQTGFTGPVNLYIGREKSDAVIDNEEFEGYSAEGVSLKLQDSVAGDGSWYQKLTSNQGIDKTGNRDGYRIQNNEENNGNCWIGRPLIVSREGSRYYIMELARSEGYELSRYGIDAGVTNREADIAGVLPSAEGTVSVSELEMNRKEGVNRFSVTGKDTADGYDIVITGLKEGAEIYTTKTETITNPDGRHTELFPVKEPVYGTPGSLIILDGKAVEASVGTVVSLPNGGNATVKRVSDAQQLQMGVRPGNAFQVEPPEIVGEDEPVKEAEFKKKVNEGLEKAGYKKPDEGSPWFLVPLAGTTEQEWCKSLTLFLKQYRVFNAFYMESLVKDGETACAVLRYSYIQAKTPLASLYDESRDSLWLKKTISYRFGETTVEGYFYHEYPAGTYKIIEKNAAGFVTAASVKKQLPVQTTAAWGEDLTKISLKDETGKTYWAYADNEQACDNQGNPIYLTRYESRQVSPGYEEKVTDTLLPGIYDADAKTYTIHIEPNLIPEDGKLNFKIKYSGGFVEGTNTSYPDYVQENAIVSAFPSFSFHGTYIANVLLSYPGQERIFQDAGTRKTPVRVFERVIRQKIKIVKDIQTNPDGTYAHNTNAGTGHEDGFTTGPGGRTENASKLSNFRFKIYLKSNLERLYRNESGEIKWLDREGKETDIMNCKSSYPEKEPFGSVQKFYTRVPHKMDSLTAGSLSNNVWETAIIVNSNLYSFQSDGLIAKEQNPGYTRLLETVTRMMEDGAGKTRQIEEYNYEKFFEAVSAANHDKWDRKEDGSTSFKPLSFIVPYIFGTGGGEKEYPVSHNNGRITHQINTSDAAKENAKVSDAVRQFAINWYLDEEVKKLTKKNKAGENQPAGTGESYQEEVYDKALCQAIIKSENYLRPFFAYDLDKIYAINWDSEEEGGTDKDRSTLSADTLQETKGTGLETSKDGYFYGISNYLPYGTYITVEQQPFSAELGDFYNRHYKTDKPKEVILPSLYEEERNEGSPEKYNHFYEYSSEDTPEDFMKNYHIRMNEEWAGTHTDDLRNYVIRAHNHDGDFEVYKYGLDADRLEGTLTYPGGLWHYQGFGISQREFSPYKDVYEAENAASIYQSNQKIGKYYHYASLSEQAGLADQVRYRNKMETDGNNPSGFYFKDGVKTITGALTGYDGRYYAALVPWTVTEPVNAGRYDPGQFSGYADGKYRNTFYASKLRIEKLDSETGENILHDGAVFALYSAEREDEKYSSGRVKFYEKDTVISGGKEFLEAIGAVNITPAARPSLPWQVPYVGMYYGTVSAGTPICRESRLVVMADEAGEKTGQFRAFTTTKDRGLDNGSQNVGYLETPQPLGAGCYVLCEIKAPAGYVRSKPTAVEIYSDEIAYYLNGKKDKRTVAAIYEEAIVRTSDNKEETADQDGTKTNGNKPQDRGDAARMYLNNTPIRLEVTKAKPDDEMASYELNGRLEGSITELKNRYGLENIELACSTSGSYLGYGWKKGFLDSLKKKEEAGESIKILYENGIFTGKAILYKRLGTADHKNRYLPGAVMTLYDAIEVRQNGDSEDFQFDGVNVVRDQYGNVVRMYVQKGFAGTKIKYVLDKTDPAGDGLEDYKEYTFENQEDDKGSGTWIYKTVEREDTDILFYDLGGLDVLKEEKGVLYSHDKDGQRIQAKNRESVFVLKNGTPFLEICCPDYRNLHYSEKDHLFDAVPEGTQVYHLDGRGNRDSLVNPFTGMAYVVEEKSGKVMVWPIKISSDQYGSILSREKITTARIASFNADTKEEWTVGTYRDGTFKKSVNPVLDEYGRPDYYQRSDETYQKGNPVYDRDGDYVRYQYDDKLKAYNDNAWKIDTNKDLQDIGASPEDETDDHPLYHRQGENCIIKNTWITGEAAPDNPFCTDMTSGQADVLKRVPAGCYIMEELKSPDGYVKTMPVALTVKDSGEIQTAKVCDYPISGYFEKLDAPDSYRVNVLDRDHIFEEPQSRIEGKGSYTYRSVPDVRLALYRAKRVSSDDLNAHPSGYYLEKTETVPAVWKVLDQDNKEETYTAEWIAGKTPNYLEAIPKGDYILEETEAPSGYVRSSMEIEIKEREGLQYFILPNDHTKVEIYKYMEQKGEKIPLPNEFSAELALYEAVTDENGIVTEQGIPLYHEEALVDQWKTDDCREYTETADVADGKEKALSSFCHGYEAMFSEYGDGFTSFSWETKHTAARSTPSDRVFHTWNGKKITIDRESGEVLFENGIEEKDRKAFLEIYEKDPKVCDVRWLFKRTAKKISSDKTEKEESVRQMWETDSGSRVLICSEQNLQPDGSFGRNFDYKFNYKKLTFSGCPQAVSYDTAFGTHRIDYLPAGKDGKDSGESGLRRGYYVLVEVNSPDGFKKVEPKSVEVEETADIQLFSLENEPASLSVSKVSEEGTVLYGANLALFRAGDKGDFLMDNRYLIETWISGEDGIYTEKDRKEGLIPEGFKAGDYKPHHISPILCGTYYLAEVKAPLGFEKMEPKKIEVTEDSETLVFAVDRMKKGIIRIEKRDAGNGEIKLSGAEFEIMNRDTGEKFSMITDEKGEAESQPLKTGHVRAGIWTPYRFTVRETVPPKQYALDPSVHTFSFEDTADQIQLNHSYRAKDEPTRIEISKLDFGAGTMVKEAVLAVYSAAEVNGKYTAVGAPLETWKSDGTPHVITGKLTAGRVYLLEEQSAPAGYTKADPVLFTISDDGRRITGISQQKEVIIVTSPDGFPDAVESLSVLCRRAVETETVLSRVEAGIPTGEPIRIPSCQTGKMTQEDGLSEGEVYEETELTHYTDGTSRVSQRQMFRMKFDENGSYLPKLRRPVETEMTLLSENGEKIAKWDAENGAGNGYLHVIQNPEYEERKGIRVSGSSGRDGSAVMPGTVIRYEVICKNTGQIKKNLSVRLSLDPQTEYMPANSDGVWEESKSGTLKAVLDSVEPGEERRLTAAAAVKENAFGELVCRTVMDGRTYEWKNPIGAENSLTLVNRVEGTAAGQLEGCLFVYRIDLLDKDGKTMKGIYDCSGGKKLRSGDIITLGKDEALTVYGLLWGARYRITEQDGDLPLFDDKAQIHAEGEIGKNAESAVFFYKKNDRSVREILKKNTSYRLVETTHYSDGTKEQSGRIDFTLDEKGVVGGFGMGDRPIVIHILKTDSLDGKILAGADLKLLSGKKSVLEEWVSGETPYELKTPLEAGELYFLSEEQPPDGYTKAEPIPFIAPDDGSLLTIRMDDRPTKVVISKTDAESGKELAGAQLELQDEKGNIVERWVSDGSPHVWIGKLPAGGRFTLIERKAPDGYWKAEPIEFTVSEDGREDKIVLENKPTRILIEKYGVECDGITEAGQPGGALIKIETMDGQEVYRFLSEEGCGHKVTGILRAGETYRAIELEAPYGYELAEPVLVPVPAAAEIIRVRIEDKKKKEPIPDRDRKGTDPEIVLHKYDGISLNALPGAVFAIYRHDGSFHSFAETGADGRAAVKIKEAGSYSVTEVKAPDGYEPSDQEYRITVEGGRISPAAIGIPNFPNQKTIGLITAYYDEGAGGKGSIYLKRGKLTPIPHTGEEGTGDTRALMTVLLLTGLALLYVRRRRKNR